MSNSSVNRATLNPEIFMHMVSSQKNIIGGVNGLKRHQLVVGRPHPVHEGVQQGIVDAVTVLPAPLVDEARGRPAARSAKFLEE